MAAMRHDDAPPADDVAALIAHIVDRFHETHRRELPALAAQARAAGAPAAELAVHLVSMTEALELHMFKEEMRLFPMMEQGGNTLIGHLIDDLEAEHRAHEAAIATLQQRMAGLADAALRRALEHFIEELQAHVHAEDALLFPRFAAKPAYGGGRR